MRQNVASLLDAVVDLTPLLHVFGARQPIDERALTRAIEMGEQRTFALAAW